ncbi:aminoacyl tRNA synthase complex-interacting multifunctional protein 1-like [Watersipora subatra]|uniref:aminoacyl tRNA synthase complex-interacting multifunctional protein 1-like n=1 Tax=Watersipora subatra TaxID=2589382 RepID=UPI00355AF88D
MASLMRNSLKDRAVKAEHMLNALRTYLTQLQEAAAKKACEKEVKALAGENEKLKKRVEVLCKKLSEVEEATGVTQVKVTGPPASVNSQVGSVQTSAQPKEAVAATVQPKTTVKTTVQSESAEVKQPTKEKKPKAKKEPKTPAAADTSPVDVSRLSLKVGKIVDVKKHPDADSLYVETVDLAEAATRTIVSGLVKHVPIEEMHGRLAIFACNLKPAKMRGILSEGMIMCASTPELVKVIDVPAGSVPGDIITFSDYPGEADKQLNPKKKIWEALVPDLKTNGEGVATYKGSPFTIAGKGVCSAPGCPNFPIK